MTDADRQIVLRTNALDRLIVDHPDQPADYVHADGTVWTWHGRWHLVGGVRDGERIVGRLHLRAYDLVTPRGESDGPDVCEGLAGKRGNDQE
jgi:hypothetical protein